MPAAHLRLSYQTPSYLMHEKAKQVWTKALSDPTCLHSAWTMLIHYDEQGGVQNANDVFSFFQVWVNPRAPAGPSCHGDTATFREGVAGWTPWESPHHHHYHHPHLSPLPKPHRGIILPLAELSGSAMPSASTPPPLPDSVSFLISQPTPSHYTVEPSTEAPSRSFISVIASQQACGSPSQHPPTLSAVGERMANPWGIDED